MKLPKREEKFVVVEEDSYFYGCVVSGIHVEIRADDDRPGFLWYFVYADKACRGDEVSYGRCLKAVRVLKYAFDFIAEYLTPCHKQEENADEKAAAGTVEGVNPEVVSENMAFVRPGSAPVGDDSRGSAGSLCSPDNVCDVSSGVPGKVPRGCVIPEAAVALDHMFDSFNSLAVDLLHMQYLLAPVLPGTGGAAYA